MIQMMRMVIMMIVVRDADGNGCDEVDGEE